MITPIAALELGLRGTVEYISLVEHLNSELCRWMANPGREHAHVEVPIVLISLVLEDYGTQWTVMDKGQGYLDGHHIVWISLSEQQRHNLIVESTRRRDAKLWQGNK